MADNIGTGMYKVQCCGNNLTLKLIINKQQMCKIQEKLEKNASLLFGLPSFR